MCCIHLVWPKRPLKTSNVELDTWVVKCFAWAKIPFLLNLFKNFNLYTSHIKQIWMLPHLCNGTNIFIQWKMKCIIQLGFTSMSGKFHISPPKYLHHCTHKHSLFVCYQNNVAGSSAHCSPWLYELPHAKTWHIPLWFVQQFCHLPIFHNVKQNQGGLRQVERCNHICMQEKIVTFSNFLKRLLRRE